MRKDEIKNAFENIQPDELAKQKMLGNIINHSQLKKQPIFMRKLLLITSMLIIIAGGFLLFKLLYNNDSSQLALDTNHGNTEDHIAHITNQFQIGDKHYSMLHDSEKDNFTLPNDIHEKDIGNKITTISTSVDSNLVGKDVYQYLPAGSEAVVAVKINDQYKLFAFLNYDSYLNNQDEDVRTYLELYGIHSADDVAKIEFLAYLEDGKLAVQNEITSRGSISEFYQYYSVLENASNEYFETLFEPSDNEVVEKEESITSDEGGGQSSPAYNGSAGNKLSNSVLIRIYNQNGVFMETIYYPNIQFISRHKVNDEFAFILKELIEK